MDGWAGEYVLSMKVLTAVEDWGCVCSYLGCFDPFHCISFICIMEGIFPRDQQLHDVKMEAGIWTREPNPGTGRQASGFGPHSFPNPRLQLVKWSMLSLMFLPFEIEGFQGTEVCFAVTWR